MLQIVRVLIVDDSAFVRKIMRQMLSRSPFVEVIGARSRRSRSAGTWSSSFSPMSLHSI